MSPQISAVEFVPNDLEAKQLRAIFDPARLDPPTGSNSPDLTIKWYRQDPNGWFRINYTDPNTGFHTGCHQDEDHPNPGQAHFQYSTADTEDRWGITFKQETPLPDSLGNRRIPPRGCLSDLLGCEQGIMTLGTPEKRVNQSLVSSFERYLQDKWKR